MPCGPIVEKLKSYPAVRVAVALVGLDPADHPP